MQFITPLGFRNAVMLVAGLAVGFFSLPSFHAVDPEWRSTDPAPWWHDPEIQAVVSNASNS
jgi:hypothetical protein